MSRRGARGLAAGCVCTAAAAHAIVMFVALAWAHPDRRSALGLVLVLLVNAAVLCVFVWLGASVARGRRILPTWIACGAMFLLALALYGGIGWFGMRVYFSAPRLLGAVQLAEAVAWAAALASCTWLLREAAAAASPSGFVRRRDRTGENM